MNKLGLIIIIVLSFLFTGCSGMTEERISPKNETWEILVKENFTGIHEHRSILIKSQKEFDRLWAESQVGIDFGPAKPKVDFNKKWIIAYFLGMVNTGGHALEIESIKPGPAMTLITIIHKRPASNCVTAQVIEEPYLLVAVDHFAPEKVEFKTIIKDIPCE